MDSPVKRLAVLGSTGSIGQQTLDVVRALPERFRVVGLAAGENIDLLAEQVAEFQPEVVSCSSTDRSWLSGPGCEFLSLEDMARHPDVDTVVMATSGTAGLSPTLAAVKAGKNIALANNATLLTRNTNDFEKVPGLRFENWLS